MKSLYYILFLLAYIYRRVKHNSDGVISLKESRPASFWVKVFLQSLMLLTNLVVGVWFIADLSSNAESLLYILPACLWGLSIHLQYFEYGRNMPHRWYAHHLFWHLSLIINLLALLFHFVGGFPDCVTDDALRFAITHGISCFVSLLLCLMGHRYRHD